MDHQIKTGENAFLQYSDGLDLWEYYSQRPEEERQFQLMLAEVSNLLLPSVVKQFSQSSFVDKNASITIVDVGGGLGGMLSLLLGEMPHAKGVLFDQGTLSFGFYFLCRRFSCLKCKTFLNRERY